ncbi:glycoside hydrolase family 3 C-terminal domain-containing protein [Dysgonomonas sp. GY617]|uniref:glycoside hydrolase family 3 C-terminal domain-containing protein n=1 Tax=Dysgonomonas sp. GY617 TaxID=2780420 RepID=UPI0018840CA7|nr:glycoside hydrolase family 3 C-terminal domain-containing protein [Dysgonomonas sp. GY617]MBF0575234.1 glycoside hydrolase family 3 C-terminal domain-containing protein [Dysgonomonas sp. GY617]
MRKIVMLVMCIFGLNIASFAQYIHPFQDTALSDEERISNLLSLMTIDEKINALSTNLGVPRLGIRNTGHSEGLHGMALGGPGNWGGFQTINYQQVPAVFYTTTFPQAYGLGETWDTQLIKKVAEIEANEVRFYTQNEKYKKGGLVMRAPNADLARDPRWGRTEESFGEDPFLVSQLSVAFIKGLQGDNPKYWKSASLMKHFLANSNEDGRDSTSSNFDERLFHEYYAYPFQRGIEDGGSRAFMASYNGWNGTAMTVHPVLKEITRQQWGNNGIICTDGGALDLLITSHKAYPSHVEGAAAIVKAGVGQFLDNYKPYVYEALKQNILSEKDIDEAIRGNFFVALRLGLLDGDQTHLPYSNIGVTDTVSPWLNKEVQDFVRLVTAKSVVLLKNEKKLLPLDKNKIKSIAVIGPRADEILLDWYSGTPPYTVSILQGIKNAVGNNIEVYYEASNEIDKASIAAQKADIAIVCVGNHVYGTDPKWKYSPVPSDGREAVDRKSLSLEQEDLVKIINKVNPNTIMLLVSSFPFTINWSQENIPAILHVTNNSQELGNGIADVLFGDFNPAGRTNQTWVKSIADLPPMMDYNIRNGRTYMYAKEKPLYPFGYGLSYTDFSYSKMSTSSSTLKKAENITVSVNVKNTGKLNGEEVVQLYVSFPNSRISRPIKQLKGFERIMIESGKTETMKFNIKASDLAYWDMDTHSYEIEAGKVNLMIGSSSENIQLTQQITITE